MKRLTLKEFKSYPEDKQLEILDTLSTDDFKKFIKVCKISVKKSYIKSKFTDDNIDYIKGLVNEYLTPRSSKKFLDELFNRSNFATFFRAKHNFYITFT